MAEIVPLPTPHSEDWASVEVKLPPPAPRIEPGTYEAVSIRLVRFSAYKRENIRIDFDVFEGSVGDGVVLARIPLFLRLPGRKGLSPNSKLARLLYLAGLRPTRWQHVSLEPLRGKVWLVQVIDAQKDQADAELSESSRYSLVGAVLEKLT